MDNNIDIRKFQEKREQSMLLAASFYRLGDIKRAELTMDCGTQLGFVSWEEVQHLVEANFCKGRLCPMCGWRRSLKIYSATSRIMDYLDTQHGKDIKYLFLTLTVRNCPGAQLGKTINTMAEAYHRLTTNRAWKRRVLGAMRTLEVTYNRQEDTYHPHYHMILAVPKDYGRKGDKLYWSHEEWAEVWQKSAKLDYAPVVSIKRVKAGRSAGIAEVSKYAVKSMEYLRPEDPDSTDKVVGILQEHLHGRRLVSYTGLMRDAQRALRITDPEDGDLTDRIRGDVVCAIKRFRWSAGLGNYIQTADGQTGETTC